MYLFLHTHTHACTHILSPPEGGAKFPHPLSKGWTYFERTAFEKKANSNFPVEKPGRQHLDQ